MVTIIRPSVIRRPPPVAAIVLTALDQVSKWRGRRCQRRSLATLDDRLLADAGLSRTDQDRECNKPFWRS
jgi:uncharacterized protein YjiS (DUF1127 family)